MTMALKINVREDQVVSREGTKVKWITDAGALCTNEESELNITKAKTDETPAQGSTSPEPQAAAPSPPAKKVTAPKAKTVPPVKAPPKAKAPSAPAKSTKTAAPAATTPAPAPTKPAKEAPAPSSKEKTVAKAKAKSKTASGTRTIGGKEVDLSKYEKTKSASGGVSYHNGDATAKKLAGKTLDEAYKIAAQTVKLPEADLRKRFKHLNVGMQRMSLGNMMRKGPRDEKKEKKAA